MKMAPSFISICCIGLISGGSISAFASDYPVKPIRVVTSEPGGSGDFAARVIGQKLTASLGHQVIVENRGGVATIPAMIVAQAMPDGHTLLVHSNSFWIGPLMDKRPYDPLKDFAPISIMTMSSNTLVVSTSSSVNSVKDLIALAIAKPGALNYGSGATGSSSHLAGELFKSMAAINVARVGYKGNAPALVGLMGGEVQFMFPSASAVRPHLKSGKLRALAVTSAEPSALAPGLPTVAESGLPGFESVQLTALFAPAKTPSALINKLNREIAQALNQQAVKEAFFNTGVEIVGSTPQQVTIKIKSEMARLGKVIADAGIKGD